MYTIWHRYTSQCPPLLYATRIYIIHMCTYICVYIYSCWFLFKDIIWLDSSKNIMQADAEWLEPTFCLFVVGLGYSEMVYSWALFAQIPCTLLKILSFSRLIVQMLSASQNWVASIQQWSEPGFRHYFSKYWLDGSCDCTLLPVKSLGNRERWKVKYILNIIL